MERMTQDDLERSDLAMRLVADMPGSPTWEGTLSRVAVKSATRAREWRIDLARLERRDGHSPIVPTAPVAGTPLFFAAQYTYLAGSQPTPVGGVFPSRSNPVFRSLGGGESTFVQIVWGLGQARPNRLLANWPACGGSIVVSGTDVEVYAGFAVPSEPEPDGGWPVFNAKIAPSTGVATQAGAELTLVQDVVAGDGPTVPAGCIYVPDFARRVRVHQKDVPLDEATTPLVCDFWDDQGVIVEAWSTEVEPGFHEVPGRATMLRVRAPVTVGLACSAHWRVAP